MMDMVRSDRMLADGGQGGSPMKAFADHLRLYGDITSEDEAALLRLPIRARAYKAGVPVGGDGREPDYCHLVLGGIIGRIESFVDGQRAITSLFLRGEIAGLAAPQRTGNRYETCSAVELCLVPRDQLLRMACVCPEIGKALLRMEARNSSLLSHRLATLSRLEAKARFANFLCEMAVRNEAAGTGYKEDFPLPLSQTQIGEILGMTSVHANRVIQRLRREGLVKIGSGRAAIPDWEALASAGSFPKPEGADKGMH